MCTLSTRVTKSGLDRVVRIDTPLYGLDVPSVENLMGFRCTIFLRVRSVSSISSILELFNAKEGFFGRDARVKLIRLIATRHWCPLWIALSQRIMALAVVTAEVRRQPRGHRLCLIQVKPMLVSVRHFIGFRIWLELQ